MSPPSDTVAGRDRLLRWWPVALLVVLVTFAWSNSFTSPFELDDGPSITENASIRDLASFRWISPPSGHGETVSGRPVLNLSFALNYAVGGLDVRSYHVTNLAIHVCAALVLFGLVRRALELPGSLPRFREGSLRLASVIAALWAVHPLQTQAVTYVVQRAESLMAFFYLLTLYGFVRSIPSPAPLRWRVLAITACWFGMATKENMVSAPVLVLLFDRAFVAGSFAEAWRRGRGLYLGLFASWVLLAALVLSTGGNRGGTSGFNVGVSWAGYVLTQVPALVRYAALSFWPHPLVFEYGDFAVQSLGAVAVPLVVVLGALIATGYALWRFPRVGTVACLGWAVLAPTSLVPGTLQMIVEHRMYLPLAAVIALTCVAADLISAPRLRTLLAGVGVAALVAFVGLTLARNRVYRSALSLWRDTVAKAPANPRAHNNLGLALAQSGQLDAAVAEYRRAIQLQPNHAFAHANLGNILLDRREWDDAAREFAAALAADPQFANARLNLGCALLGLGRRSEAEAAFRAVLADNPSDDDARTNLATVLLDTRRAGEAESLLRAVLAACPDSPEVHRLLGRAIERNGDLPGAEAEYRTAVRLNPAFAEGYLALGNLLGVRREFADAEAVYREALRLAPALADAHFGLGNVYAGTQRFDAAIREYQAALALAPDYAEALGNLANCQLMTGAVREAVSNYERVLELRPDSPSVRRNLAVAREMLRHP